MPPKKSLKQPVNDTEAEVETPMSPSKIKVLKKSISKKSIPKGNEMVEELPLKQRPSAVSLTKKRSATQKWTFKKSLASSTGGRTTPTGIKGKRTPPSSSRSISSLTGSRTNIKKKSQKSGSSEKSSKEKLSKPSNEILKVRSPIKIFKKSSHKRIKKDGDLPLNLGTPPPIGFTERLFRSFKYRGGRVSDVDAEGVGVRGAPICNKKRIMVTLLILLILLIALAVIIVMYAIPQGAGRNNTTPVMTTMSTTTGLPTTTDKCGDIPPRNESQELGEYCYCKVMDLDYTECQPCCQRYQADNQFRCDFYCRKAFIVNPGR